MFAAKRVKDLIGTACRPATDCERKGQPGGALGIADPDPEPPMHGTPSMPRDPDLVAPRSHAPHELGVSASRRPGATARAVRVVGTDPCNRNRSGVAAQALRRRPNAQIIIRCKAFPCFA